ARRVAAQIAEGSAERDRERRLPFAEVELLSQSGLWGITVPKAYGGPGVSNVTFAEVVKTLSAADASIGQIPQNHFANVEEIRLVGTEAQKKFFFERIMAGDRLGNAAIEAGGKTARDVRTRAVPDGDDLILTGEKFYCTGALFAHWVPVKALDEGDKPVMIIVDKNSPGLTVVDDWSGFGQRTTASGTVKLANVRVPKSHLFDGQQAYRTHTTRGPFSQLIHVAIDVGIALAAIEETARFLRSESRPWIDAHVERATDDPLTIAAVGDLQYRYHAAEALLERAARQMDRAMEEQAENEVIRAAVTVAEAKIGATEIALLATNKLFELAGTKSTLARYGLDRHWRNARVHTLHDPVRWKYHLIGNYYLNGVNPPRHAWS
ncbi:MAG TPA: SfnB family sulfur acquisition oxidoreductase, partial [Chthoniobacterales bacterium]